MLMILTPRLPFNSNRLSSFIHFKLELAELKATKRYILSLFHPDEFVYFSISNFIHVLDCPSLFIVVKSFSTVDASHFDVLSLDSIEPVDKFVERL